MELCLVGVNHQRAPVAVRSRFSFTDSQKITFLTQVLDAGIPEVVVLSTCNRSTVYFAAEDAETALEQMRVRYLTFFNGAAFAEYLVCLHGREAVYELFCVTCGLRSAVIGEDQILGQVRDAVTFASQLGATGKTLNKLFREAITLSKAIKTELKISQIPLSVSYIGLKLLEQELGNLTGKRFLLTGFGKMNQLTLKYLLDDGAEQIILCNRTLQKVEEAQAQSERVISRPFADRYDLLPQVDAVITATAAPHAIFHAEKMPDLQHPLYLLDLAVPPDVASSVMECDNVHVFEIDDIKQLADAHLHQREQLAQAAEARIQTAVDDVLLWMRQTRADPTIQSINARCHEITEDTTQILTHKLDLTERESRIVNKMVMASLQRLIRAPMLRMKSMQDEGMQEAYIQVIETLFDL